MHERHANKKPRNKVFYYDYNKTMKQEKDVKKAKFKKRKTVCIFLPRLLTILQIKNNFPCF